MKAGSRDEILQALDDAVGGHGVFVPCVCCCISALIEVGSRAGLQRHHVAHRVEFRLPVQGVVRVVAEIHRAFAAQPSHLRECWPAPASVRASHTTAVRTRCAAARAASRARLSRAGPASLGDPSPAPCTASPSARRSRRSRKEIVVVLRVPRFRFGLEHRHREDVARGQRRPRSGGPARSVPAAWSGRSGSATSGASSASAVRGSRGSCRRRPSGPCE